MTGSTAVRVYDVWDQPRIGNHGRTAAETAEGLTAPEVDARRPPFKNASGVDADPSAVTLRLRRPDGSTLVYAWPTPGAGELALNREALGRFYADVLLDQAGEWRYTLRGSGAVVAAATGRLVVEGGV